MLRRDVIREIVKRDNQYLQLNEETIIKDAKSLYDAACEHFGAWDIALRYAGVEERYFRCDRHGFSRERVVRVLRKLCTSGYNLAAKHNMHRDYKLYQAAIHYFGSWHDALEAAGINCRNIQLNAKPRRHDKQKILEKLRERHNAGLAITWPEVCLGNRTFALAAKQAFGSWRKALVAAGIWSKGRGVCKTKKWDAQKVIAHIQERHQQNKSLMRKDVLKEDASFVNAVRRYFKLWHTAIKAAGVVSEERNQTEKKG